MKTESDGERLHIGVGSDEAVDNTTQAFVHGQALPNDAAPSSEMIFSDFYKGSRSPLARLRHHHPQLSSKSPTATPDWVGEEYADLLSRDKAKQKEAVRRYLAAKIRQDWEFPWPPPAAPGQGVSEQSLTSQLATTPDVEVQDEIHEDQGYRADEQTDSEADASCNEQGDDDDADSIYSVVSEDNVHYRPRAEWTSDLSDEEEEHDTSSPFRFDSPDNVGSALELASLAKRARRRRDLRNEMTWNPGLACFEARRNAWTGARTVRVRSKPLSVPQTSPKSPRKSFFRRSLSSSPPNPTPSLAADLSATTSDTSSLAKDEKDLTRLNYHGAASPAPERTHMYPVRTLLPLAQPLLPPTNPLRASITPSVYLSLYDKVILHNLQPSCPINLADMLRSCVSGWKRDGEWPPRPTPSQEAAAKKKQKKPATPSNAENGNASRRLSFGRRPRENQEESRTGKGFRRSLQRAFGLGQSPGLADLNGA